MSDYFTQFSCSLDVGSAEHAARALDLLAAMEEGSDDEDAMCGLEVDVDPRHPGTLFITDGDGFGDPEHVIAFVLRCAEAFDLTGRWGFTWALTCSRHRPDGFGGGAQLLDLGQRKSLAWTDCSHWLAAVLDPAADPDEGVVFA